MLRAVIQTMNERFPYQLDPHLDERLSHLVFRQPGPDLAAKLHDFLAAKGIKPKKEALVKGSGSDSWMVISFEAADIRSLVLEIVGQGFGEGVVGMYAKASAADASLKKTGESPG